MDCSAWTIRISLVFLTVSILSCHESPHEANTLFALVPASHSNIKFQNKLHEDEDFNIIEYLYFYNGGGVAIGDINNDGLPDVYFSSNQESNRLYLNRGGFVFEDITDRAGVAGQGNWKTGVVMADVNGDGFLDIFSCGVGKYKKFNGRNTLYINNGNLSFSDSTEAYGLAFQGFSTQASFFDYDNDGDLDMYLLNHSVHSIAKYGQASSRYQFNPQAGDRLYRNDLIPSGKAHFTDVTAQAGILSSQIGYGLGVGVSDLNADGYSDIYISNDFRENDYLYINQRDGTFKQELEMCMPHTSRFSMGNDIGDINNDGLNDIVTLDMLPKDEGIIKTTAGDDPYDIYQYKLQFGYHPQLSRNALQINRGVAKDGGLLFSDIAAYAGVEASDWSWAPLLADLDNDGYKDLFVANGILRRPNDLDYINFIYGDSAATLTDREFAQRMPSGAVANVVYRNNGDLSFTDVSREWIGSSASLSNGAAYADLDGDGDLDIVTNNVNDQAFVYRNDLPPGKKSNYLNFRLHGIRANTFGVGARIVLYARGEQIDLEQTPSRGWQSSVDYVLHAGVGSVMVVDSVCVRWPGGAAETRYKVHTGEMVDLFEKDAVKFSRDKLPVADSPEVAWHFRQLPDTVFIHHEDNFVSFNTEKLIPHMLTTQGPKISAGDVNGDGLEDFFIGGAAGQAGAVFVQRKSGAFVRSMQPALDADRFREDTGSALFDVDGNGTLDLLVAGGGQEFYGRDPRLMPALYLNGGRGNFTKHQGGMPSMFIDASCVKPADVDGDGDMDVFIGGRVVAGQYGVDPLSSILINDGRGNFTDQGRRWFSGTGYPGMVSDAQWVDLNGDNRLDLIIVGEWMPVSIYMQTEDGRFSDKTKEYGLDETSGWWNTVEVADVDNDGDADILAGNLGLNSRLRASVKEPVSILMRDIDENGSLDQILAYYNQGKEYPFITRDQLVKQVPALKAKFLRYESFRNVQVHDILPQEGIRYVKKTAKTFASIILENDGNGKFTGRPLPAEAQLFPIFSMHIEDLNGDGNKDILGVGNLTAVQPDIGRYDAGYGVALIADGRGGYAAVSSRVSGFVVPGEGRDIEVVKAAGRRIVLVARNNEGLIQFDQPGSSR